MALGVPAIALFPVVPAELKSDDAAQAWHPEGLVPRTVRALKERFPELGVITDIALDPYTSHGQDGLIDATGYVMNDETVVALVKQALATREAGVDIVAPSDMMDGRIGALRDALDGAGHAAHAHPRVLGEVRVELLRTVPRRGRLGGEPRAAATSTPTRWTRRTATRRCGRRYLDIDEGADMVMVKPGLPYLDIVRRVKDTFGMPTAVYQVSGEYAMLKAAAQNGWLDERACVLETLLSMKRAGADAILTYFALDAARWLADERRARRPQRVRVEQLAPAARRVRRVEPRLLLPHAGRGAAAAAPPPCVRTRQPDARRARVSIAEVATAFAVCACGSDAVAAAAVEQRHLDALRVVGGELEADVAVLGRPALRRRRRPAAGRTPRGRFIQTSASSRCARRRRLVLLAAEQRVVVAQRASISSSPGSAARSGRSSCARRLALRRATSRRCRARRSAARRPARSSRAARPSGPRPSRRSARRASNFAVERGARRLIGDGAGRGC